MKKILISIRPKYVAEILNHRKTLEIRKSAPKCELPCEVYIYCTKENRYDELLVYNKDQKVAVLNKSRAFYLDDIKRFPHLQKLNGKVVAKFVLNKVSKIKYCRGTWNCGDIGNHKVLWDKACLDYLQLEQYLNGDGYAWHIDKLVPFDRPKELKEFFVRDKKGDIPVQVEELKGSKFMALKRIEHAPQSFMFIEVDE